MNYIMVAIRDSKSDTFTPPSFFRHQGQAIRAFQDNIQTPPQDGQAQLMARHRNDYDLYDLGTYDDNTAEMTLHAKPQLLFNGSSIGQGE